MEKQEDERENEEGNGRQSYKEKFHLPLDTTTIGKEGEGSGMTSNQWHHWPLQSTGTSSITALGGLESVIFVQRAKAQRHGAIVLEGD